MMTLPGAVSSSRASYSSRDSLARTFRRMAVVARALPRVHHGLGELGVQVGYLLECRRGTTMRPQARPELVGEVTVLTG